MSFMFSEAPAQESKNTKSLDALLLKASLEQYKEAFEAKKISVDDLINADADSGVGALCESINMKPGHQLRLRKALKTLVQLWTAAASNQQTESKLNSLDSPAEKKAPPPIEIDPNLPEDVQAIMRLINVCGSATPLEGASGLRKMLSVENNPPIQKVIDAGGVPALVKLLQSSDVSVQFEAAWGLTNISSGTSNHTQVVVDSGALNHFKRLLSSPSDDVKEQVVWAMGNIAGDTSNSRNAVLQVSPMKEIKGYLNNPTTKLPFVRNMSWSISNFCRGKPKPVFDNEAKGDLFSSLQGLVRWHSDEEVFTNWAWAMSYLSDGSNERIQEVLDAGLTQHLVQGLTHNRPTIQTPCLRTIGNIVTGNDNQTNYMIQQGVIQPVKNLLSSTRGPIRKEACWTLSNITAGNLQQIQQVIDAGVVPRLIHVLNNDSTDVKKEAAWAVSNMTSGGSTEQIASLGTDCMASLCRLLEGSGPKVIMVCLEGIENLLRNGQQRNSTVFSDALEMAGGLDTIEELQQHASQDIYQKAVTILTTYFNAAEDEET